MNNKKVLRRHNDLSHAIADASCESADMKSLLEAYWDSTFAYVQDLNLDELAETAIGMGIEVEKEKQDEQ